MSCAGPSAEDRDGGSKGPPRNPPRRSRGGEQPRSNARSWAHSGETQRPAPPSIDPSREKESNREMEGLARPRPFFRQRDSQEFCGHPSGNEDREDGPEVQDTAFSSPPRCREPKEEYGQ